ncbi:MAG: Txe/YoeB family addiction module toxin [Candidatus Azotimanducaceae bacterium]|uniref:Putative mRNA interferase YoeB n=1 Tax=OM182 bacterium TaxID=2510334 RepID=A0A520S4G6_9GAMM|nr:Txe/YoeB family addiction module toxin [Gammaproteobacteria bacterium]OUV68159.1 MAG: Txe/YoeB family addiction module toxin [Gammaproteobacteria bacterium TMED133]RZO77353.1 MAG: Txe/YoeB family addiction module toxin [OM182 bacterium]
MTNSHKWTRIAWSDYQYWCYRSRKTQIFINQLIKNAEKTPTNGLGKPEKLVGSLTGLWSRKIDTTNRLIYAVKEGHLIIISCRYHLKPRVSFMSPPRFRN